jgi:hypothetical protein
LSNRPGERALLQRDNEIRCQISKLTAQTGSFGSLAEGHHPYPNMHQGGWLLCLSQLSLEHREIATSCLNLSFCFFSSVTPAVADSCLGEPGNLSILYSRTKAAMTSGVERKHSLACASRRGRHCPYLGILLNNHRSSVSNKDCCCVHSR